MSTEAVHSSPAVNPATQHVTHPLAPLTGDEITRAAELMRSVWPSNTDLHFKSITLEEPPKAVVLPLLEAEHNGQSAPSIARKAFVNYYIRSTVSAYVQVG